MASLPTTNISVNNLTIQTGILAQNAGVTLVYLTIDPKSTKAAIGLACFETTKIESKIASDVDIWKVPVFDGVDSETEPDSIQKTLIWQFVVSRIRSKNYGNGALN